MISHLIKVNVAMVIFFSICFLTGINFMAGYAFFAFLIYITFFLTKRFILDTKKTIIKNHKFGKIMAITVLAFLPYLVLIIAGGYAAAFIGGYIEIAVDYCYKKTENIVKYVERTEEAWSWTLWRPWTYWWKDKTSKTIVEEITEKVSFYQKILFSLLYSFLRCLEVLGFSALVFWALSRFADLYVKTALRHGVIIKYRWCSNGN